ncbi:proteasome subunit alpha type 3, putative [Cryptosporidium muris RN66]|uniref:Proteasome subunit alpha type n=1 Tax=Cryptosporidium muris (strain RN66) TaxID=441375 RepID=B6AGC1_CRYMR|nr:proteasome subunit alpha type 3, putative [Cryptosporidium muris RN66]EEA07262.1 proteasome subunit alpha type 3, putative [Cryptosporidium muris RN66]|eukprot:XP_002141611.1 proteasome subunit alpha type 3 [Cryptosporidium muris RN66]
MASTGAGYDVSVSTFSPDGRVFQVEYANKAVDNSGTAIALIFNSGILFAVDKYVVNKMAVSGTNRRVFSLGRGIGCCIAGFVTDSHRIVNIGRSEAANYQKFYGETIPIKVLAERIAMYMHAFTLYGSVRPFGCSILIGGIDPNHGTELYCVSPSGSCYKYKAMAIGKGRQIARNDLEKLIDSNLDENEAMYECAKIIKQSRDEGGNLNVELELALIGPSSNSQFSIVSNSVTREVEERVDKYLDELTCAE